MNFKVTSCGTCYEIEVDGVKYTRQDQSDAGEVLTISEVRPVYSGEIASYNTDENGHVDGTITMSERNWLELAFTEMPKTRFRPGQKIRVVIEP